MKTLFLTFVLALISTFSFAQSRQVIDSLKHELAIAKHDTSRVLLMVRIGNESRWSKPSDAMRYSQQALQLAQQRHFLRGECLALAELGNISRDIGNLPKSLEVLVKALSIAESNQYQAEASGCYSRMGNIYNDLKDYKKALMYAKKSQTIAEQIGNRRQKAIQYLNIGAIYQYTNQLDSAEQYLQLAYQYGKQIKIASFNSAILRNLGLLREKLKNYPLALSYYRQGIQTALDDNDHRNAAFNYNAIASYYQHSHQLDSCIFYAQKALAEAKAGPFNRYILEAAEVLVDAYREKQDFRQALAYQDLAIKTKESLFGAGNIQAMQTIIANEEKRQQEVKQAQESYQAKLKEYILLGGLGIFLLIAFFLYRNNRQKQKANTLLQHQKEEIDHQKNKVEQALSDLRSTQAQLIQKEKLASLGELTAGIAHEIQNPLNFVNNFSEVSIELIDELKQEASIGGLGAELIDDVVQNLEKINLHGKRAASIVKGMLEHSRMGTGERQLTDLNVLCEEYLRLSYYGMKAKDKNFQADHELIADPNLPKISVVPQDIGRVLLNLLNNAFYAVNTPTITNPKVIVSTSHSDEQVIIKVQDNGTGIPDNIKSKIFQPFFTTKPTGEGTGLGLSLAYDIVTKGHGGTMEVESAEGEGATFVVKLPM